MGQIGAERHTPGNELTGLVVNHAERVISIDDLLVSHAFIADIDEAMNHYDVRAPYTTEMGRKLAKEWDISVFKELVKGANASALVTDGNGGSTYTNNAMKNDGGTAGSSTEAEKATALGVGVFKLNTLFDQKDAPEERFLAVKPEEYYCMVQNTDLINRDWGGAGAYSDGKIFRVAGVNIVKSNNVPTTDTSATDTYHGVDASAVTGVMWTREGAGTVKLLNLGVQSDYQVERQGTLMVARYAVGHGYLRPDCCGALLLDTLTYA